MARLAGTKKAAVYIRTSTTDQHLANQKPEIEALAQARGFEIVEVFEEQESAVKRRPVFERMLLDARRGRFAVIVVWSLDRLGRGFSCFDTFRDLAKIGVQVVSVREPWTEADGPARELLVAVMAWVSGFERDRLIERTKAGLRRARDAGKRLGRPATSPLKVAAGVEHVRQGSSLREAARLAGVNRESIRRALKVAA